VSRWFKDLKASASLTGTTFNESSQLWSSEVALFMMAANDSQTASRSRNDMLAVTNHKGASEEISESLPRLATFFEGLEAITTACHIKPTRSCQSVA
jgi:hypothetical protein